MRQSCGGHVMSHDLPVEYQLCNELQDGCSDGGVVVPDVEGLQQDLSVGGVAVARQGGPPRASSLQHSTPHLTAHTANVALHQTRH